MKLPNGQGLHESQSLTRFNHKQSVGFVVIGGQLGQELVVRYARRGSQAGSLFDGYFDLLGNLGSRLHLPEILCYVEVSFIK